MNNNAKAIANLYALIALAECSRDNGRDRRDSFGRYLEALGSARCVAYGWCVTMLETHEMTATEMRDSILKMVLAWANIDHGDCTTLGALTMRAFSEAESMLGHYQDCGILA